MKSILSKQTALELLHVQHKLFEQDVSTLIVFEGAGGNVMSRIVNEIISAFEPRGLEYAYNNPDDESFLVSQFMRVPAVGKMGIYDRAWYSSAIVCPDEVLHDSITVIRYYERYLIDNKVNVIKIYLNIDGKTLKKYSDSYPLPIDKNKGGYLSAGEGDYKAYSTDNPKVTSILESTNYAYAPWSIVDVTEFKETVNNIAEVLLTRLNYRIEHPNVPEEHQILEIYPNVRKDLDYSTKISPDKYGDELDRLQMKLTKLQMRLATSDKSLCLVFEGWDAAGKGGTIKRVTKCLNPRGYEVIPICAPTAIEKAHTHLWRFVTHKPQKGHITIFDRSWYGRMMVEPIEGFCTEKEYSRAGDEINMLERIWTLSNIIVIKFWIDITSEEQLARFNARKDDPLKNWKLTDEDWRNREKWPVYEKYVNSMIEQTNTPYAPWYAIANNDKKSGRLQVLKIITDTLERELKEDDKGKHSD